MDQIPETEKRSEEMHDTILVAGLVCIDLIFSASHYPREDSMNRALDYERRRGGNASNSCTVLSQLGAKCELLAVMTSDEYAELLRQDLMLNNIIFHHCPVYNEFSTPITNVVLSLETGTRTILHFREKEFPENKLEDFSKIDLSNYKWIHFEGRGVSETLKMIDSVDEWNTISEKARITYSVELEKCADVTKNLLPRGDYVFVGKEFAKFLGYHDAISTLQGLAPLVKPGAIIIVPWGELGAAARCLNGHIITSNACPPQNVLDTTGAGDTFIAATIFYLSKQKSLQDSIDFGNKVAGAKCGMMGFIGINSKFKEE